MPKRTSTIIANKTYYYTSEACQQANISRGTLFRWIKEGIVPDAKLKDRNGWRLFSNDDIKKLRDEAQKTKNVG